MVNISFPADFKEFLKLLNEAEVEYLLIGGYAVSYHGYPRATADMDVWVAVNPKNADKIVAALHRFGFVQPEITPGVFLEEKKVIRMGVAPLRIEICTGIDGVNFPECYARKVTDTLDGIAVSVISLQDLKLNKKAAGRHKDLDDLEHLP